MVKFIIGLAVGVLAVVFIVQNVETVEITFLAWTFSAPRAAMLVVILFIGIFVGWVVSSLGRGIKQRRLKSQDK